MTARTIAIGDIHGCSAALRKLLEAVRPAAGDRLVILGDYVDRGPDSRGVIETILELREQFEVIPLQGNHEVMMLNALDDPQQRAFWLNYGGRQTVDSYGTLEDIPPAHVDFLQGCVRYFEAPAHLFLHANYLEDVSLAEQPESIALWTHLTQHLPRPHRSGKTAIVGHTPQVSGTVMDVGYLLCIDTFCCGGRWLTALDVESRRLWQSRQNGETRSEILETSGDGAPGP